MEIFRKIKEIKSIREALCVMRHPVNETFFSAWLTSGRANNFKQLNGAEYEKLKQFLETFTKKQLLDGINSIAFSMAVITTNEQTETNDKKVIDFLQAASIISSANEFRLQNKKRNSIVFSTPFKDEPYVSLLLISILLSDAFVKRSTAMN